MKVHELCAMLANCNQEADVVVTQEYQHRDYTWDIDQVPVIGILAWPEPSQTADRIELIWEEP